MSISKINKNVQLIYTENCDSPFTTGLFSPMIVLPHNTDYTAEQLNFIIRHDTIMMITAVTPENITIPQAYFTTSDSIHLSEPI